MTTKVFNYLYFHKRYWSVDQTNPFNPVNETGNFTFVPTYSCNRLILATGKDLSLKKLPGGNANCTFREQTSILWKCVARWTTLRDQRVLDFSPAYKLDSAHFESQVDKVRKSLPANFFNNLHYLGDWLDNKPDEPSIWFTQVFALKDQQGNYKVYAAIKIQFDGTDASIDGYRRDPKITGLTFIFDRKELDALGLKLKNSPRAGGS